jgi:hypothetical protein
MILAQVTRSDTGAHFEPVVTVLVLRYILHCSVFLLFDLFLVLSALLAFGEYLSREKQTLHKRDRKLRSARSARVRLDVAQTLPCGPLALLWFDLVELSRSSSPVRNPVRLVWVFPSSVEHN